MRTIFTALVVCGTIFVIPGGCGDDQASTSPEQLMAGDHDEYGRIPKVIAGFAVSHGAAAGYIEDTSCQECHQEIYDDYQAVGMSQSFYPPSEDKIVEPLEATFHHQLTGRYYQMSFRNGKLYQERYQLDEQGRRFAQYEAEVAWIIGSGNHVRSYLSHSPHGELFQLPLSWYAESGWGMSPGYDRSKHFGFERRISRHCMFCHNAYPEVPVGTDLQHAAPLFPPNLPHGIGCQRCHGPGARHVEIALDPDATDAQIRSRIINTKNHSPEVQNQLCMTCHLQPETLADSQMLPRAFDKPLYQHRPDQSIRDWITFLDHGNAEQQRNRTQVNHHAYRLRFSKCYSESAEQLGCTSCHNPHKKVAKAQRPDFYRAKCLQCHELTDCAEPSMGQTRDPAQSDCVSCHMVKTRPADVVHATVTDHYIRRRHPSPDPAAARPEQPDRPAPTSVEPLFADTTKTPQWKVLAGLATAGSASTQDLREWQQAFEASKPHNATAYVQIGAALGRRDREAAIQLLREGIAKHPKVPEVHWELGDALWMTGDAKQAVQHLSTADQLSGQRNPDIAKSLGIACALAGELPRAAQALQRSLRMRPNDRSSWLQLANTLIQLRDLPAAAQAFERAIELVPDHVDAYRGLSGIYGQLGRQQDALRVLRQGASILLAIRLDLVALHCLSKRPEHFNPTEGLRLAQAAVDANPQDPRSHLHRALAISLSQPAEQALSAITQAATIGADPACCDALRALVHHTASDFKQASHYLNQFRQGLGTAHREPLRKQLAGFLQTLSSPGQRKR